jgi:hypothetical protein
MISFQVSTDRPFDTGYSGRMSAKKITFMDFERNKRVSDEFRRLVGGAGGALSGT